MIKNAQLPQGFGAKIPERSKPINDLLLTEGGVVQACLNI